MPGNIYRGFCETAAGGGCASDIVSFSGRRAVYFGRTTETHLELFRALDGQLSLSNR